MAPKLRGTEGFRPVAILLKIFWRLRRLLFLQGVSLESATDRQLRGLSEKINQEREVEFEATTARRNPVTGRVTKFHHPRPVIYELSDVTFTPSLGYLGYGGRRILESAHPDDRALWAWDSSRLIHPKIQDSGPLTAMNPSQNYYHFLLEDLPRLVILKKHADVKTIYMRPPSASSIVTEACHTLGLTVKTVAFPVTFPVLHFVAPLGELFQPSALAAVLTNSLFPSSPGNEDRPKKKIFVSRRFSSRSLPYELAIERWLERVGYEILFLEQMSLAEQYRFFSAAKTVVGIHGAGLSNMVFMPPGGTVVELLADNYPSHVFETLASGRQNFIRIGVDTKQRNSSKVLSELQAVLETLE